LGRIRRLLEGRTTLFCGPSGGGKSSLLNAVYPGFRLKVGSISEATGKGTHTTTTAELMPLPYGGFVVDTPGLKEFGLWRATREELEGAFPEIAELAGGCRFADCSHVHEPDCAVLGAVEAGTIDPDRHQSYSKILTETIE
jgi:ribosome biogenesis GTPase